MNKLKEDIMTKWTNLESQLFNQLQEKRFEYIYHMIIGIMAEQDKNIDSEFAIGKECEKL